MWLGSVHDSRMFPNSRLCAKFENHDYNGILLGDSGYALKPYLLTPILNPHTPPEIVSEYDQEIPQSQTADNPTAPRGRAAQLSRDTRKTK